MLRLDFLGAFPWLEVALGAPWGAYHSGHDLQAPKPTYSAGDTGLPLVCQWISGRRKIFELNGLEQRAGGGTATGEDGGTEGASILREG